MTKIQAGSETHTGNLKQSAEVTQSAEHIYKVSVAKSYSPLFGILRGPKQEPSFVQTLLT